jgi:hypothetical protein
MVVALCALGGFFEEGGVMYVWEYADEVQSRKGGSTRRRAGYLSEIELSMFPEDARRVMLRSGPVSRGQRRCAPKPQNWHRRIRRSRRRRNGETGGWWMAVSRMRPRGVQVTTRRSSGVTSASMSISQRSNSPTRSRLKTGVSSSPAHWQVGSTEYLTWRKEYSSRKSAS